MKEEGLTRPRAPVCGLPRPRLGRTRAHGSFRARQPLVATPGPGAGAAESPAGARPPPFVSLCPSSEGGRQGPAGALGNPAWCSASWIFPHFPQGARPPAWATWHVLSGRVKLYQEEEATQATSRKGTRRGHGYRLDLLFLRGWLGSRTRRARPVSRFLPRRRQCLRGGDLTRSVPPSSSGFPGTWDLRCGVLAPRVSRGMVGRPQDRWPGEASLRQAPAVPGAVPCPVSAGPASQRGPQPSQGSTRPRPSPTLPQRAPGTTGLPCPGCWGRVPGRTLRAPCVTVLPSAARRLLQARNLRKSEDRCGWEAPLGRALGSRQEGGNAGFAHTQARSLLRPPCPAPPRAELESI